MAASVIAWINAVHLDARERQAAPYKAPRILLPRSADARIAITVRDSSNARVDVSGATLTLTFCRDKAMAETLFAVTAGAGAAAGEGLFVVTPDDTAGLTLGHCYYTADARWADGKREQLVGVTDAWLAASAGASEPIGGTLRALRVGKVMFDEATEKAATFGVPFDADGFDPDDYLVVLTPAASTDGVTGPPYASFDTFTRTGLSVQLSGPYTGSVTYAIYRS